MKAVQFPSIREKYLEAQSSWFQEFLTDSLEALQHYYIGRVQVEGRVVLLEDATIQLQSTEAEKMFLFLKR